MWNEVTGPGWSNPPEEDYEGDIGRSKHDRKLMTVLPAGRGKHAITSYKVLEYFDYLSLVEVRLKLGVRIKSEYIWGILDIMFLAIIPTGELLYDLGLMRSRKVLFHQLITDLGRQALHADTWIRAPINPRENTL